MKTSSIILRVLIVTLLVSLCSSTVVASSSIESLHRKSLHRKGQDVLHREAKTGKKIANKIDVGLHDQACEEMSMIAASGVGGSFDIKAAMKLTGLFTLWYAFNAAYNVYNSYMKKDYPLPWSSAALQLLVGLFYAIPLWILKVRKTPQLTLQDFYKLLPIALLNAGGHACAVNAMFEKGGGSFTHVIKASEPVVSVILGFLVNRVIPRPLTAASLLPITYGVAYASTLGNLNVKSMSTELTTKAAKMAMGSNVAFAMRSILRKNLPLEFMRRTNLDAANEHAVATLLSFILLLPFAIVLEGISGWQNVYMAINNKSAFLMNSALCGMTYYLYNEMQNVVLGSLGPVPTAVGNTLKRVFIFVALYLFTQGETFPLPKVIGSGIAIAGCLAFAVCDSKKI